MASATIREAPSKAIQKSVQPSARDVQPLNWGDDGWGDGKEGTTSHVSDETRPTPAREIQNLGWGDDGWTDGVEGTIPEYHPKLHIGNPKPMEEPNIKNGMMFPTKGRKAKEGLPVRGLCGTFAALDYKHLGQLLPYYKNRDELVRIPKQTCLRLSCYHTAAIYLCNTSDRNWIAESWWIAHKTKKLKKKCSSLSAENHGMSGRMWLNNYVSIVTSWGRECAEELDRGPFITYLGPTEYPFRPWIRGMKFNDPPPDEPPRGMKDERGSWDYPFPRPVWDKEGFKHSDLNKTDLIGDRAPDEKGWNYQPGKWAEGHGNASELENEKYRDDILWHPEAMAQGHPKTTEASDSSPNIFG